MRYVASLMVLLLAIALGSGVHAKIIQKEIEVPVEVADATGRLVRQPIKVTVFRDDARARSPFLILNHGRSSDPAKRAAVKPAQFAANASYFASLGFAVFFPVRIGNGATGGPDLDASGPCRDKDYRRAYEVGAAQSNAVIAHAKSLPYVDASKGIVLGQSFGGTLAITLAGKRIEGVLAAVNFAGGAGGRPINEVVETIEIKVGEELAAYAYVYRQQGLVADCGTGFGENRSISRAEPPLLVRQPVKFTPAISSTHDLESHSL